jgi:hypothetical protein
MMPFTAVNETKSTKRQHGLQPALKDWRVKAMPVRAMTITTKAILVGCSIEGIFAGMLALGGFGPCGPSNPLGLIGMLGHVFPGFIVAAVAKSFCEKTTFVVVLSQAAFWSGITYIILRARTHTHKNEF